MRTPVPERHERILQLLEQRGQMRVADLAKALDVSAVTARRDVEVLERQGALQRRHGVAFSLDAGSPRRRGAAGPGGGSGGGGGGGGGAGGAGGEMSRAGEAVLSARLPARSGFTPLIGMVVPSATYYYADVIRGARAAVSEVGGRLVIGLTHYDPAEEREQIRQLQARGVHALLLTPVWPSGTSPEEESDRVASLGLPTVLVERRGQLGFRVDELDRVCSNHAHGAYLAVQQLANQGRKRIAVIARESPTAAQLQAGAAAALRHLGVAQALQVNQSSLPGAAPAAAEQALVELVERARVGDVDGVLVHTDEDAVQFVHLAQRMGLRVPDDVAVIAYDDEIAGLADPPLTAVAPPKFAVGQAAARMALTRLAERRRAAVGVPAAPRHHLELLPELRVRESCGAALARRGSQKL